MEGDGDAAVDRAKADENILVQIESLLGSNDELQEPDMLHLYWLCTSFVDSNLADSNDSVKKDVLAAEITELILKFNTRFSHASPNHRVYGFMIIGMIYGKCSAFAKKIDPEKSDTDESDPDETDIDGAYFRERSKKAFMKATQIATDNELAHLGFCRLLLALSHSEFCHANGRPIRGLKISMRACMEALSELRDSVDYLGEPLDASGDDADADDLNNLDKFGNLFRCSSKYATLHQILVCANRCAVLALSNSMKDEADSAGDSDGDSKDNDSPGDSKGGDSLGDKKDEESPRNCMKDEADSVGDSDSDSDSESSSGDTNSVSSLGDSVSSGESDSPGDSDSDSESSSGDTNSESSTGDTNSESSTSDDESPSSSTTQPSSSTTQPSSYTEDGRPSPSKTSKESVENDSAPSVNSAQDSAPSVSSKESFVKESTPSVNSAQGSAPSVSSKESLNDYEPLLVPPPRPVQTSWKGCCGLFELFPGSGR